MTTITLPQAVESRLRIEAPRRGLDSAAYAAQIIAASLSPHQDDDEADEPRLRGVVPVELSRELLFTRSLPVRVGELPGWKPQISRRDDIGKALTQLPTDS